MTVAWDELAVAALLGTDRRRVDVALLPGAAGRAAAELAEGDGAAALLDGAALLSAYRRGGQRPAAGPAPPSPAGPETSPTVPAAAAARLVALLDAGDRELVTEWLAVVGAAGCVAPPAALPALLDLAAANRDLAAAVQPVLGRRGAWLARLGPQWRKTVRPVVDDALLADDETWRLGDATTRRAWFAGVRRADPARARDLLATSWARETGPDREAFLDALGVGLSAADEPLLEPALDDRRQGVRERAAALLARLPASAFAGRMRARATATVVVERKLLRERLVVRPPAEYDAAMRRDRLVLHPGQTATAQRSLLVTQIVAATPLEHWTTVLHTGPEGVLRTPVPEEWRANLVNSWARAAVRQRDPRWAAALALRADPFHRRDLVALLPPADLAQTVAGLFDPRLDVTARAELNQLLDALPGPWPEPVAAAALAWLATPHPQPHALPVRARLALAGRRLPVATAERVSALTATLPDGSPWRAEVSQVAGMLAYRRAMHEEMR